MPSVESWQRAWIGYSHENGQQQQQQQESSPENKDCSKTRQILTSGTRLLLLHPIHCTVTLEVLDSGVTACSRSSRFRHDTPLKMAAHLRAAAVGSLCWVLPAKKWASPYLSLRAGLASSCYIYQCLSANLKSIFEILRMTTPALVRNISDMILGRQGRRFVIST